MITKHVKNVWASILLASTFLVFANLQPAYAVLVFPPVITADPTNQTVTATATATFSVTADGSAPLSYQWYFNDAAITDATNSVFTLDDVQPGEAGAYYATVSNAYGSVTSATATLTVNATFPPEAPYIITEPTNQTVTAGDTAAFNILAVGGSPLSYQWYFNGTNLWGATSATLILNGVSSGYAGPYYVTVTDTNGSVTSSIVTLTVNASSPSQAPYIITQPSDETVTAGSTATFSVTAGGATPLSYLWYFDGTNVVGTNATLVLDDVSLANTGSYQVFISNAYGSTNSIPVILSVNSSGPSQAPYIVAQPANQTVTAGGTATFSVTAGGAAPLSYLWYFDGTNVVGTNATLVLNDVSLANTGSYQVFISNAYGSTNSIPVLLSVSSASSCDPAPSGIVAWWPGESNTDDIIGGNNGIASTELGYTTGEVGQAFSMNSTNANFFAPASPSLNVGTHGTGLTMEAWIKPSNVNGMQPIAEWNSSPENPPHSGSIGVQLWIGQNPASEGVLCATFMQTNDANFMQVSSPSGSLVPNVWQHVAMTYDKTNGTITLYINETMVASQFWGHFIPDTSYNFWVDHRPGDEPGDWTYGTFLSGPLDELSLYNRALSSDEIAAIYQAGSEGKCTPASTMAPYIIKQPTNQTVTVGGTATFSVTAGGAAPLQYLWYFDGTNLVGTNATLVLNDVSLANTGSYQVFVSNAYGTTNSIPVLLSVSSSSSCYPAPSGIVAWWPGEGNTDDIIGGNNGVVTNGTVGYTAAEVGLGFNFNGGPNRLIVPDAPSLDIGSNVDFTIEGWIRAYPTNTPQGVMSIIDKRYAPNSVQCRGYEICLYNGQVNLRISDDPSGNGANWTAGPNLLDGQLHYIAATIARDSTNGGNLYVDGINVLQFDPTSVEGDLTTTQPLRIGNHPDPTYTAFFDGQIDELSLYKRALSSSEIAAIYQAGSEGKCTPISTLAPYIITQPANQTVAAGGTAIFSVAAGGAAPLSYIWYFDNTIGVGTNATLVLHNVTSANAGNYQVFVSNAYGSTNSVTITLAVSSSSTNQAPYIITQPTNETVTAGGTATFSVTAGGSAPLQYLWYFDGTNVVGTNATLVLDDVSLANTGSYQVFISNAYGSTNSIPVTLSVSSASSCDPAPSGIVAWWPGEGNTDDIIGGNNGVVTNGTVGYAGAEVGLGFNFNGGPNRLIVPDAPSLDIGSNVDFTIEGWIRAYPTNTPQGVMSIIDKRYAPNSVQCQGYEICLYNGQVNLRISDNPSGNGGNWTAGPNLLDGQLHHIAATVVRDSTNGGNLYVDGTNVLRFDPTSVEGDLTTTQPLRIGNHPDPTYTAFFDGQIDELSLYKRAVSSSEIVAIYHAGSEGKCTPTSTSAPYIITQPANQTVTEGGTATFSVAAGGTAPLSYLWYFDQTNVVGTNATLVLDNVTPANVGAYQVFISNAHGSTNSISVTLNVFAPPPQVTHFAWSPIPSPRFRAVPFTVTITALDAGNNIVTNFTSTVHLTSTNLPVSVPITPLVTTNFVQGSWTGTVEVLAPATNVLLLATDALGHRGISNPFVVVNTPMLIPTEFGKQMQIMWPVNPAGFVLEMTTNLALGNWVPVPGQPLQSSNQCTEAIKPPSANGSVFYRLHYTGQ